MGRKFKKKKVKRQNTVQPKLKSLVGEELKCQPNIDYYTSPTSELPAHMLKKPHTHTHKSHKAQSHSSGTTKILTICILSPQIPSKINSFNIYVANIL